MQSRRMEKKFEISTLTSNFRLDRLIHKVAHLINLHSWKPEKHTGIGFKVTTDYSRFNQMGSSIQTNWETFACQFELRGLHVWRFIDKYGSGRRDFTNCMLTLQHLFSRRKMHRVLPFRHSLGLSPCNFFLIQKLKEKMEGWKFATGQDLYCLHHPNYQGPLWKWSSRCLSARSRLAQKMFRIERRLLKRNQVKVLWSIEWVI